MRTPQLRDQLGHAQLQLSNREVVDRAKGILNAGPVLRYADGRTGQHRAMRLHTGGHLQAFVLAGDLQAASWVLPLLQPLNTPVSTAGKQAA